MAAGARPVVHVIGTGGTISSIGGSRTDFLDSGYTDRHYTISEMLGHVPEIEAIATVRSEQFSNVYGGDLSVSQWIALARRINQIFRSAPDTAGLVVTHGTSTLEETAFFLNLAARTARPVVVTGAMRPLTALSNDAEINLLDSLRVAASEEAVKRGVLVVSNNQIQAARDVTKSSTSRVDTFRSSDLGFLGYADADGQIVFYRTTTKRHTADSEFDVEKLDRLPRVDIALAHHGADGAAIDGFSRAGCEGVVVSGLGSASAPKLFLDALAKLVASGVAVVIASQASSGRVMGRQTFLSRGFVTADNLQPRKARILLMLALTRTKHPEEIQRMMDTY